MADRNLLLELLITAKDEASAELRGLRSRLDEVGDGAENAGQRTKILQEAMGGLLSKLGGALALGALVTQFVEANRESALLGEQFRAMTGDAQSAGEEIDFLRGVADRWGLAVNELAPAHLRLSAATKGTTAEGAKTRQMMEDLAAAYVNAGAGTEDLEESMEILGETFAEGRVSIDDIKEGMQEDMPPAIQAATTAVLENDEALKKMMATGSAATEDFMPAFAAALRKHIGGSATHIDSSAAALSRVQEEMKALYVEINSVIPIMTVFDGTIKGLAKTAEIAIGGLSTVTKGVAFVGNAMGAAAGALSQGEDVMAAVGAEADKTGSAIEKTALHLVGLKTETELATERQAQMKAELQEAAAAADPYGTSLEALKNKLKDAHEEFARTGDVVKLTQTALADFFKTPEQKLNTDGVLELAATLKSVGDQAEGSGQKISATLGQELSKLTDEQLKKLEAQARKSMTEVSQSGKDTHKNFAELGQIIEGTVLARLQKLGVDGPEALKGISIEAKEAIGNFGELAKSGVLSGEGIEKAFEGALAKLDNPKELEAFQEQIIKMGKDGTLTGEQVERALLLIRQRIQDVAKDPAFAALSGNLAKIREDTQRGTEAMERWQTIARTQTQAALELAKAKGDEAAAAKLSAKAAQEEVAASQERLGQLKGQKAEIADHIRQLMEQARASGQVTDEQRKEIDALSDKSAALGVDIVKLEAHLPAQQRAAEQAERMAGPVGQLTRLYEQKTAATQRETEAVERGYDSKIRDLNVEKDQAEAKGDAVKAAELSIKIKQEEAAQAQAVADAKGMELQAEIDLIEAKKAAIPQDEKITSQGQEKLAAMDAEIAKLRDLKDAEQDKADSAKAAAEQEVEAAKKVEEAKKAEAEAAIAAERETRRTAAAVTMVAQSFDQMSEAGKKAWDQFKQANPGNFMADAVGAAEHMMRITRTFDDLLTAEVKAAQQVDELAEAYSRGGQAGVDALRRILDMGEGGTAAIGHLTEAGEAARQKIEDIRQEAMDAEAALNEMADGFTREMLQLQGDQKALLELEQRDRLKQLEEAHQRAGQLGDEEYRTALARAEELHRMKLAQLEQEQAAKEQAAAKDRGADVKAAADSYRTLGNELERVNRLTGTLARSDLSEIVVQANALRSTLADVSALL